MNKPETEEEEADWAYDRAQDELVIDSFLKE